MGTGMVRMITASAQFILALWLTPTAFGHWAAAISSSAIAVALTNFGMVDGYLARRGVTFSKLVRDTTIGNGLLATILFGVAAAYFLSDRSEIGILVVLAAVNIPLTGLSEVLIARSLKASRYRYIVVSQVFAGITKLAVGVALAIITGSALAIGVSGIVFALVLIVMLVASAAPSETLPEQRPFMPKDRLSWAANALAMKLPPYVGLFVAQFLTTPEILGVYYLSYQGILAISSVVAPPLKRVVLNSLAQCPDDERRMLAIRLSHVASSVSALATATAILALPFVWFAVPESWSAALLPVLIFMSQLPGRMLSPVLDAYEQACGYWGKSTRFHIFDALGISVAALSAATDDLVTIAICISAVRIALVCIRCLSSYPAGKYGRRLLAGLSLSLSILLMAASWLREGSLLLVLVGWIISTLWVGSSIFSTQLTHISEKLHQRLKFRVRKGVVR